MVTEETELKNKVEQNVRECANKIDKLTEELGLPKFQVSLLEIFPDYFSLL